MIHLTIRTDGEGVDDGLEFHYPTNFVAALHILEEFFDDLITRPDVYESIYLSLTKKPAEAWTLVKDDPAHWHYEPKFCT